MRRSPSTRAGNATLAHAAALALGVIAADLATKWFVERRLDEPISVVAGVRLELGHNPGIAFGALNDLPSGVLVAGVTAVIVGLLVALGRGLLTLPWPALGLLLGGAAANLLDRLGDGRVTDFIDPPRWPAFNVADIAITCAVLLILRHALRDERPGASANRTAEPSTDAQRVRRPA